MRSFRSALVLIGLLAAVSAALAQGRGNARVHGKVLDEAGKPLQDVQVQAVMAGQTQVFTAKTNNKGDFQIRNLAEGSWKVDFSKEGLEPFTANLDVTEDMSSITVKLVKAAPDPTIEINEQLKKAAELAQGGQVPAARKIYEDILAKYPTVHQMHNMIARTHAFEGNADKALEHLRIANEKEPNDPDVLMLMGDLLMEKGQRDEALKLLNSVDLSKVQDPASFANAAISLINAGQTDDALTLLEKVIAKFPQQADLYYYRGRAYVAAKKYPEAQAEFEKFVAMPNANPKQVEDAKNLLEQLKK
jgi:tetratricopeptide (TPR) repeat protein